MKYIKNFNEELYDELGAFAKTVKEICDNSLIYLIDDGFTYHIDFDSNDYTLLYINSGLKEIKFVDILPDIQQFVELLSRLCHIDINVAFYFKTLNGYILDRESRSRNVHEILTVADILNGIFDMPTFNTTAQIVLRFELKKKKVTILSKVKKLFSKY